MEFWIVKGMDREYLEDELEQTKALKYIFLATNSFQW